MPPRLAFFLVIAFVAPADEDDTVLVDESLMTAPAGWTAETTAKRNVGNGWRDYTIWQPVLMSIKLESGFNTTENVTTPFNAAVAFHVHHFRGVSGDSLLAGTLVDTYNTIFPISPTSTDRVTFEFPALAGSGQAFFFSGFALGPGTSLTNPPIDNPAEVQALTVGGTDTLTTFSFVELVTLSATVDTRTFRFTPDWEFEVIGSVPYAAGFVGGTV